MVETEASEYATMTETGKCCALLEAVLRGLTTSNCWAVDNRPDWETGMAKPSGEERRFTVLLEDVEKKFAMLLDGHADLQRKFRELDTKVDRIAKELSDRMDLGFATVMKELRNHHHN